MKPSGPTLFFLEWFLITNSIYLTGMEPLRFPVSFCLSFDKLHLSISSKLSNLLAQSFHNIPGDSLWQDLGRNYQLFKESVFSRCPSITAWLQLPALLNSDLKTIVPPGPYFLHFRYGFMSLILTRQYDSLHTRSFARPHGGCWARCEHGAVGGTGVKQSSLCWLTPGPWSCEHGKCAGILSLPPAACRILRGHWSAWTETLILTSASERSQSPLLMPEFAISWFFVPPFMLCVGKKNQNKTKTPRFYGKQPHRMIWS